MLLEECAVCRIISGESDATKLLENEYVVAFWHISPVNPGHLLVVPKDHVASIAGASKEAQAAMMQVGADLGHLLIKVLDVDGFNLHLAYGDCAGQGLSHTHLHVIPRSAEDGFHWNWRTVECSENVKTEIVDELRMRIEARK